MKNKGGGNLMFEGSPIAYIGYKPNDFCYYLEIEMR